VNVVLKGTFIVASIKNEGRSWINNLALPLKELEKEQTKAKVSKRKEIKIRVENNWNKV
jgi:hypothetical protein